MSIIPAVSHARHCRRAGMRGRRYDVKRVPFAGGNRAGNNRNYSTTTKNRNYYRNSATLHRPLARRRADSLRVEFRLFVRRHAYSSRDTVRDERAAVTARILRGHSRLAKRSRLRFANRISSAVELFPACSGPIPLFVCPPDRHSSTNRKTPNGSFLPRTRFDAGRPAALFEKQTQNSIRAPNWQIAVRPLSPKIPCRAARHASRTYD